MASSSTISSSIAQVSRESVRVQKLRGSVQTVFPVRACMPPTANNSETQDYGTVGSDGPIEGAAKVMVVLTGVCCRRSFREAKRRPRFAFAVLEPVPNAPLLYTIFHGFAA